jgi:hypothetical protein
MKRVALKRKVSLRDSYRRKLKERGTRRIWGLSGFSKRKPLKKVARSQRQRLTKYFALSTAFLLKPENKLCVICQTRREHGEDILINNAVEVHHFRGRIGRLLCWVPGFRASCFPCRSWPHDNPTKARAWGLLAPAALWNVYPGDGS